MYEGRVTEVLEKLLVTRGDISRPVGAGKLGMKTGERSSALYPQLPMQNRGSTGQEGSIGVYLAWVNPAMRQTTERRTKPVVSLMIVRT